MEAKSPVVKGCLIIWTNPSLTARFVNPFKIRKHLILMASIRSIVCSKSGVALMLRVWTACTRILIFVDNR